MTLTELKYIVAVARERHFGRAAEACFVSQPTLSVAIKKLEDELNVQIFERGTSEVSVTPIGEQIVTQAQRVLEQTLAIKEIAKQGKDPLLGPLRLGVIYTIGPYLLPTLVKQMIQRVPQMPLMLQENFTLKLIELLKQGEIDVAIMALPFPETGLMLRPLYDEPFVVALPSGHAWESRPKIDPDDLKQETMLLLGSGHCFRDHVLGVCPELMRFSQNADGIQKTFEGSSLETIRHMVASGVGITVLPAHVGARGQATCGRYRRGPAQLCRIRRAGARSPRRAGMAQELHAHARDRRDLRSNRRVRPAGRQKARSARRRQLTRHHPQPRRTPVRPTAKRAQALSNR
ncbi:LysR family hydrogen peroxide-inducible transcriptional activator [Paraburkholderia sp. 40]